MTPVLDDMLHADCNMIQVLSNMRSVSKHMSPAYDNLIDVKYNVNHVYLDIDCVDINIAHAS